MSRQQEYKVALDGIANDLDGFLGASLVDATTGMALASRAGSADFDLNVAAAYNSEMLKSKKRTLKALNLESEFEEMLVTLEDQYHLIHLLEDNLFLYVATSRQGNSISMLQAVVRIHLRALGQGAAPAPQPVSTKTQDSLDDEARAQPQPKQQFSQRGWISRWRPS
ncbi:hypothetical protein [Corynebacterium lubricantis]|uniref:hypothetical protein n=1 Tax=Corynebacterium lubricantis TaxID=541095 RepID=UPI001B7FD2D6|nr:hypothetical protein [Corynebacterium lubricantis]